MQRLWNDLTKPSPSHLSIVGPRYSGKSVILSALASRMEGADSPYRCVVLWDLGHLTPTSDADFLKSLCAELSVKLAKTNDECSKHLSKADPGDEYGALRDVMEMLNEEGVKILMLWDGFDKPLSSGLLTRNLWDQLRELASSPSLRLVTASRRPLPDLIRSSEEAGSDFWNVFDQNHVRVGAFSEDDCSEILSALPELALNSGAATEIGNWSAGYPPLFLSILNELLELPPAAKVDNGAVNDAAQRALGAGTLTGVLDQLWADCPATTKDLYTHLVENGEVLASEVSNQDKLNLSEKSLVRSIGNKVTKSCRLLESHIASLNGDSGSVVRLFTTREAYEENLRGVLQLRLDQMKSLDKTLRRFIERSIEDIPGHPEVCLQSIRGIVDRALGLVWAAELGPTPTIPSEWLTDWQYHEKGSVQKWTTDLPKGGDQIRLLQLLTGTENCSSRAKHVSRNVYVLANAAHGFGNFGQHLEGAKVPVGVAVSAVMTCLELAACLERELP